jgi:X-X-X-Leu-X-X-Gly heptad repeat protein
MKFLSAGAGTLSAGAGTVSAGAGTVCVGAGKTRVLPEVSIYVLSHFLVY